MFFVSFVTIPVCILCEISWFGFSNADGLFFYSVGTEYL